MKTVLIAIVVMFAACKQKDVRFETNSKANFACTAILKQDAEAKVEPQFTCAGESCMHSCIGTMPNKQVWLMQVSALGTLQPACLAGCPEPKPQQQGPQGPPPGAVPPAAPPAAGSASK